MDYLYAFVTVVIGLLTLVYLYSKWKHSYWKRRGIPQLEPEFFYGNIKGMVKGDASLAETNAGHYREIKGRGLKYAGLYSLYTPFFMPVDPELIKDIVQKNFEHFNAHFVMPPNPPIFNQGLFDQNGEPWKVARKKLTPTFTSGKMKMMFEILSEKTNGLRELAAKIAESGEPANIKDILARFTTDVVGSCGFGLECNSMQDPDSAFFKHGKNIFDPPKNKKSSLGQLLNSAQFKLVKKDLSETEDFFKKTVTETIKYREKNKIYRKDFMHLMIQLKNRGVVTDDEHIFNESNISTNVADTFSVDEIIAQCMIFFVAGFDTSAAAMTFALLELAQNQDIQDKVRQEVNSVLKKHNDRMTYEAMMDLKYTEKVINESLRRYPPAASLPRTCTKDYRIPGTDCIIEKGTPAIISVWGLQMDPEYFPNPEKFDPERFNEENKKNIKDFTYLPFGEGPRMCIGLRFAMMQSKVGLASLIQNFKFTPNDKTPFPLKMKRDTVITYVDGDVWLNIKKI